MLELARVRYRKPLTERHRARARNQAREAGKENGSVLRTGAGYTHDQTEVRNEPIAGPEHGGAQVIARSRGVPRFPVCDISTSNDPATSGCPRDQLHDRRVPTLFGGKRLRVRLTRVFVAIGKLGRGDRRHHKAGTKAPGQLREQTCAKARHISSLFDTRGLELTAPDSCMRRLRVRQLQKKVLAVGVAFRGAECCVKSCAIQLVTKVVPISPGVIGGHAYSLSSCRQSRARSTRSG